MKVSALLLTQADGEGAVLRPTAELQALLPCW